MTTMTDQTLPNRSFIIPVLDYSPHSPYNIRTLLAALDGIDGEVIVIFNSRPLFDDLHDHPRITRSCLNSQNAGVSRSWNIGLNLAEGRTAFILNADLHITREAIDALEGYLRSLPRAVLVGPEGSDLRFDENRLSLQSHYRKGDVTMPRRVDNVSGFLMAIDRERFVAHGLMFDTRFSPCFMEEWDIGFQISRAGLACYVVPVGDYDHHWGVSQERGQVIHYFGRPLTRAQILADNSARFAEKWQSLIFSSTGTGG
jgi:GT2 family glycosyltransferase